jgi:ketosteroid isomerase-like protein
MQAILRAHDERSVWIEPGDNERTGVFRGAEAILGHGMHNQELTGGTLATEVQEILAGDEYVTVIERATAQRGEKSLDMLCCTVYRMAGGAIAEMRVLPFDSSLWQIFWA